MGSHAPAEARLAAGGAKTAPRCRFRVLVTVAGGFAAAAALMAGISYLAGPTSPASRSVVPGRLDAFTPHQLPAQSAT